MALLWFTLILVLVTFIPTLELRASIPLGILASRVVLPFFGAVQGFGLPWWYVVLICVLANTLLALLFYWFLDVVVHRLLIPSWPWFARFYARRLEKAQRRIRQGVERWGWLGLAAFIAIPLPGSGVYTGGLVAYAVGMSPRRFYAASFLGVLGAATLVTAASLGVLSFF